MWARLKFEAIADSAETLADCLDELGALAVTLQAAGDEERFDTREQPAKLWQSTEVCAWFDAEQPLTPIFEALAEVAGRPTGVEYVADRDWVCATRDATGPLHISDRLWVVPSWCDTPEPDALSLVIDPGLAFGTGRHPTTQMSLRWLASQCYRNCEVLDYGCGSGILAIAAVLLGARRAVGIDVDPAALAVAAGNAAANGVVNRVEFRLAAEEAEADYGIIVANILLRPLLELVERFAVWQAPGGRLALSGITADQQNALEPVLAAAGYGVDGVEQQDHWILLTAIRQ